ncbi:MAG: redoxin family protein [Myxococcales bacterium]|nr:redoxin family protein [Myxococcales bacterium]
MNTARNLALALTALAAMMMAGCGAEGGGAATTPLTATGTFTAGIDNSEYTVDYAGAQVTAELQHKLTKEGQYACVPSVKISITPKHSDADDKSCGLDLEFKADFNGELKLKKAKFYAKSAIFQDGVAIMTFPCEGWAKEPASGEVVYESLDGAEGSLSMKPIAQPQAGQAKAVLSSTALSPKGIVDMKFKGRKFKLDLSQIKVNGSVTSAGSEDVSCAQKYQPLPFVELKDINPGSPLHNQTYSLEEFKGKYVAVLMGAGWCASCLSQTDYMQKIKTDLEAQGRKDFAMVVMNDKTAAKPNDQKKISTCNTKGKCTIGENVQFTVFQADGTYGWSSFTDPKTGQKGKKNDCFIYAPDGRFIFKHIGKGTVQLGQFDSEVRAALNTKIEDIP